MSPSSQRAWIEIVCRRPRLKAVIVALLAEGVDRNLRPAVEDHIDEVALLAEGVDRNIQLRRSVLIPASSPSSQRAWIEIPPVPAHTPPRWVALLAEGVDRNFERPGGFVDVIVALLAEGVDRNISSASSMAAFARRPPRRGRG